MQLQPFPAEQEGFLQSYPSSPTASAQGFRFGVLRNVLNLEVSMLREILILPGKPLDAKGLVADLHSEAWNLSLASGLWDLSISRNIAFFSQRIMQNSK